ncbi:MAG: glycosyltransferase family 2 protein [Nitrospirota bacterium]
MTKLTAIIPVFNEEQNLEDCLRGLTWADEILVVDSGSTDGTLSIAHRHTDRILQHEYVNSAAQKNWTIPQARHDWVLIVDADERVTPELQEEIRAVLREIPPCDGYSIRRKNYAWGKPIRYCGWQNDRVLRLFNRHKGRYQDKEVHADVVVQGTVGDLSSPLLHYTYRDLNHYFEKFQRYTRWGALDLEKRGKQARWYHLLLHPTFRFLRMYVFQRGFMDGLHGLVLCMLSAFSVFTKYAKLWDLNRKKSS